MISVVSWDRVVGLNKAKDWLVERVISGKGKIFVTSAELWDQLWVDPSPYLVGIGVVFPGLKCLGHEADHSPTPLIVLRLRVTGVVRPPVPFASVMCTGTTLLLHLTCTSLIEYAVNTLTVTDVLLTKVMQLLKSVYSFISIRVVTDTQSERLIAGTHLAFHPIVVADGWSYFPF